MTLDIWSTPDQLYHARSDEVPAARPYFTGDVLDDVPIPGAQDGGAAVIVAHPCSMRGKHAKLKDRLLVASVEQHQEVPPAKWTRGYFDRMPLPEVRGSGTPLEVAWLDRLGRADTEHVVKAQRVACLSSVGVNILQQRMVFHLTRLEVPTADFWEAFGHTYEEADLLEEWTEALSEAGVSPDAAAAAFEEWIREDGRQDLLRDPQARAPIRSAMRRELRQRAH